MAIKETPTNVKTYYKLMQSTTSKKLEDAKLEKDNLEIKLHNYREEIEKNIDIYKTNFGVCLTKYKEYVDGSYISGDLFKIAKGLFINRNNNYELVTDLYNLYQYAQLQKRINDVNHDIALYEKLLKLSLKEYTEILRAYYTEVHKKMILEGNGYAFANNIGWICINRCAIKTAKPWLDYAATKKREAELIAQGKRIWNKEEADWCARNGIEYKAEDKRVFKNDEYCYEIPLIDSHLPNGTKLKLEISDYRHTKLRGKTNDTIIKEADNDIRKICELPLDLKTKLTLCDKTDKILYSKFIRNEAQKSLTAPKVNRKG